MKTPRKTMDVPRDGQAVPSPVDYISGIWQMHREPDKPSHAFSTPGHLFHYLLNGSYSLTTNNRVYRVQAGDVIYYHGSEKVKCQWDRGEVDFISVAFHAPRLEPRPLDQRVFPAGRKQASLFKALFAEYMAPGDDPARLRLFALLHQLLFEMELLPKLKVGWPGEGGEWNSIEESLRREGVFQARIEDLCARVHCSRSTLTRLCRRATGDSPQTRLRAIRMEEARGLLTFSPITLSEIATLLGFSRQHEFTREFSRQYGYPPSRLRSK